MQALWQGFSRKNYPTKHLKTYSVEKLCHWEGHSKGPDDSMHLLLRSTIKIWKIQKKIWFSVILVAKSWIHKCLLMSNVLSVISMIQRRKILLNEPVEKYYPSMICGKSFNSWDNFWNVYHITDWLLFPCIFYLHMWAHTGEEPYQCNDYENAFLNNIHLIGHFKIHTGEKPCQCNQCAKAFSMKCDLKWHLKIHSGDKLCKCSYYDKVFYSKNSDLTEHLKTNSGEKVYQCSHCDKTFYKVLIL